MASRTRVEFSGEPGVRRWMPLAGVAALLAVLLVPLSQSAARAEIVDLAMPDGCYDSVAGAVGMFDNIVDPGAVTLEVGGPVERVIVEWLGEFTANPVNPAISLEVNGTSGTIEPEGLFSDVAVGIASAYAYYGDATSLFDDGAGTYEVVVTPPPDPGPGDNHWWGATVTVVYDTSPCGEVVELIWKVGADYYFGGDDGSLATTAPIIYEFTNPLAEDLDATVRTTHGGADSVTTDCRVSTLWAATGTEAPPGDLVGVGDGSGEALYPGAVEAVVDPFNPPSQPCPARTFAAPVTSVAGGHVGPQYALVEMDVTIPAGSQWFGMQLLSPPDNDGHAGLPESGSWAGAGLLLITGTIVPDIALEKTVLDGAGGACPGTEGTDELVTGAPGDPVTYCFKVTNTGDTPLDPVTLDDPDLGITHEDMTLVSGDDTVPLGLGGELVYSYETTLDGDLVNTATVAGTPVDDSGEELGVPDVTDENDAAVEEVLADIALEKTVLDGAGGACPGEEGTDELVTGAPGDPVTYCFRVTNTGDFALNPVELDDPDLGITDADMTLVSGDDTGPLDPGDELVYSYEATIDGDLLNTATVIGHPVEGLGDPVTDTNDAEVQEVVPDPGVLIEKTVLEGPDGACPGVDGTDELVSGEAGTPVTYCFRVENTGDTGLFPVTIDDPDLGITEADMTLVSGDDSVPLPPGGELVYSYEATITEDLVNVATVTGTPVDDEGEPIDDLDDVTDDDDAAVEELVLVVEVAPACDNDTPYLNYDIQADGLGTEATITFSDGDDSESVVVPVGTGRVLWPGAAIDDEGNPTDWPGYDLDENGEWFLNPDNPYAWAREDVTITVEVNPTSDPVTVSYPPAEPTCTAAPPPAAPPADPPPDAEPPPPALPELPETGSMLDGLLALAVALLAFGSSMLVMGRGVRRRG